MQALSKAGIGAYTIKWMFGVPEVLEAMHRMNVKEGSDIEVLSQTVSGVVIRCGARRIAVGSEAAARIQV